MESSREELSPLPQEIILSPLDLANRRIAQIESARENMEGWAGRVLGEKADPSEILYS